MRRPAHRCGPSLRPLVELLLIACGNDDTQFLRGKRLGQRCPKPPLAPVTRTILCAKSVIVKKDNTSRGSKRQPLIELACSYKNFSVKESHHDSRRRNCEVCNVPREKFSRSITSAVGGARASLVDILDHMARSTVNFARFRARSIKSRFCPARRSGAAGDRADPHERRR